MGVFFSITPPNKLFKTSYFFEQSFNRFPTDKESYTFISIPGKTYTEEISVGTMKFSFGVKSKFGKIKRQSFFSFGASISVPIETKITQTPTVFWGSKSYSIALTGFGGIGYSLKRLSSEIRFETGSAGYLAGQFIISYQIL